MFPPIKVATMNLSSCKRVVLFNNGKEKEGDEEDEEAEGKEGDVIEFRHYGVSARQRAVNRAIKKLVNNQRTPNLAKFDNIADFILKNKRIGTTSQSSSHVPQAGEFGGGAGAYSSESEIEDLPGSKITLPEDYRDMKKDSQVAIRLHEIGPRMKLRLVKIEEGLCRGNVVFHAHQSKTPA
jgi:ribosome biogenesis protein SSF1/2